MYYSIKKRLLLGVFCILLAALVPAGVYAMYLLRGEVSRDARDVAMNTLRGVEWTLAHHPPFGSPKDLDAWAAGYGAATGVRVSYIVNGTLVADTQVGYERLALAADHSLRPEIVAARKNGRGLDTRFSTTVNMRFLYAALSTGSIPGFAPGVLRIAMPDLAIARRLDRVGFDLALAFAGAFVLGCFLLGIMLLRGFRYLDALTVTAQAIGLGDYARRMPDSRCRELRPFTAALNGMAVNIGKQMREIAEEKNRLETVLNAMSEGVLALSGDGRVLLGNPAARTMFSGMEEGRLLLEVIMNAALHEAVSAALSGEAVPGTVRVAARGGGTCSANIVPLPPGGVAKLLLVFTDISERERLDAMRRDFVANVSHELRTPLTSIRGYAELLRDDANLPEATRAEFLDIITRSAEHMARMTDSLLSLARAEHAGARAAPDRGEASGPTDAAAVLRSVLRDLGPAVRDRAVAVSLDLPAAAAGPEAPLFVRGGADGLAEVFRNLLDNALKYGGNRIELGARAEGDTAVITVRDNGPGIPEESRERIFERFYRLKRGPEGKSAAGSAGLGLAICRHIVRNLGGSIRVGIPADGGPGTAFVVRLPLAGGDAGSLSARRFDSAPALA